MGYTSAESVSLTGNTWVAANLFYVLMVPALLLWYIYWRMSRRHFYELADKLPGPAGLPILGNALEFTGGSADIFRRIYERSFEFNNEGVVKLWIGPRLLVFLFDPRDVEIILSSHVHIDKATEYRFFKPWLGNGLLISTGQKWRTHRKLIAPTFHLNVLKSFMDLFNANSRAVVDKLNKEANKEVDCHDYMSECTVEILLGAEQRAAPKTTPNRQFRIAVTSPRDDTSGARRPAGTSAYLNWPGRRCSALSCGWLVHILNVRSSVSMDTELIFSPFISIDFHLKPGLSFDSYPSHNFDSDSNPTFVFDPGPVLDFTPASNCDPVSVLDFVPRLASNSYSATNHGPDLDEAKGKQFLCLSTFAFPIPIGLSILMPI
ncbi:Cytochrome P450 4g15 [Eumeta japonica]|uniref:Cytochrome P450 4g15 n=1 Tax=Eumeta variegata TaxID=151549 RepID=A0A4C1X2P1_EUMVA|nr:Cytochrome P450 4g15 [Eumeta japonica]